MHNTLYRAFIFNLTLQCIVEESFIIKQSSTYYIVHMSIVGFFGEYLVQSAENDATVRLETECDDNYPLCSVRGTTELDQALAFS